MGKWPLRDSHESLWPPHGQFPVSFQYSRRQSSTCPELWRLSLGTFCVTPLRQAAEQTSSSDLDAGSEEREEFPAAFLPWLRVRSGFLWAPPRIFADKNTPPANETQTSLPRPALANTFSYFTGRLLINFLKRTPQMTSGSGLHHLVCATVNVMVGNPAEVCSQLLEISLLCQESLPFMYPFSLWFSYAFGNSSHSGAPTGYRTAYLSQQPRCPNTPQTLQVLNCPYIPCSGWEAFQMPSCSDGHCLDHTTDQSHLPSKHHPITETLGPHQFWPMPP